MLTDDYDDNNNDSSKTKLRELLHPNLRVAECQTVHRLMFTKMRNVDCTSSDFVRYSQRSMHLLAEEALASCFSQHETTITTPCGECKGWISELDIDYNDHDDDDVVIRRNKTDQVVVVPKLTAVSIVRSGDALLETVRAIDPTIRVGKIVIQRDETSTDKHAVLIYEKLPPQMQFVLLCDPMLATGGSAIKALEVLTGEPHNVPPRHIVFANMISCPEGLKALAATFPDVQIITAAIDSHLNKQKYIVPGLGDYGDRFFNTTT
jgi:uracil phosphoribosyltransferase